MIKGSTCSRLAFLLGLNRYDFRTSFSVWQPTVGAVRILVVTPTRRLEDYIRSLCRKMLDSDGESEDFRIAADQLRSALLIHIEKMREKFKNYPLIEHERRSPYR